MIKKIQITVSSMMLLSVMVTGAYAQNVPASARSGVVDRKQKKVLAEKKIGKTQIKIEEKEQAKPVEDKGPKFPLKEVSISGNTVVSTKALQKIFNKYTYEDSSVAMLNQLCEDVQNYYKSKGYVLVKCYLPQQEIKDGKVQLAVVEGFLNKVIVKGNKYYKAAFIKRHFSSMEGDVLNYNRLLRQLNILNDFFNLQVKTYLQAGDKPNSTDMVIEVVDSVPVSVSMNYDNTGSRYVSEHKAGLGISLGNLVKNGDKITIGANVGEPVSAYNQYSLSYELPVFYSGTKLTLSADRSEHELGDEFAAFDIGGNSTTYKIGLLHPFISKRTFSLDAFIDVEYKNTKDEYYGATSADNDLNTLFIGSSMQKADRFNGYNFITLKGAFGLSEDDNGYLPNRLNTEENFTYFNLNYYRMQRFAKKLLFVVKAEGQVSMDRLPTSQQYGIGGLYSVRGYTASRFLGDSGFNTSLELYVPMSFMGDVKVPFTDMKIADIAKFKIFADYGYIKNKDVVAGEISSEDIYGYGVGLDINTPNDLTFNITVGFPGEEKDPAQDYSSIVYVSLFKKFM